MDNTIAPSVETQDRWEKLDDLAVQIEAAQAKQAVALLRTVVRNAPGAAAMRLGWNDESSYPDFEAFVDANGADLDIDPLAVWDSVQPVLEKFRSTEAADKFFDEPGAAPAGPVFNPTWMLRGDRWIEQAHLGGATFVDRVVDLVDPDDLGPLIEGLQAVQQARPEWID